MKRLVVLAALAMVASTGIATAGPIIYDGGGPNGYTAYYADTSYPYTTNAESFVLQAGASTVADAHWWGICGSGTPCSPGDFTLGFYTDNGGQVGSLIQSYSVGNANQTLTGNFVSGVFAEYSYSANFAPLALAAGTNYWFTVSNTTPGLFWAMETTGTPGAGGHWQFLTGFGWDAQPDDLAFNLTGPSAVPEPTILSLLGLGLVGAVARRSRKAASRI